MVSDEYKELMAEAATLMHEVERMPHAFRKSFLRLASGLTSGTQAYCDMVDAEHPNDLTMKQMETMIMMEMVVGDALLIRKCLLLAALATFDEHGNKKESPRG